MNYQCPVCGFNQLKRPPKDFYICSCCGTEFDNDDFEMTHDQLRSRWIASGMHWFSDSEPSPYGWNAVAQLHNAGLLEIVNQLQTAISNVSVDVRAQFNVLPRNDPPEYVICNVAFTIEANQMPVLRPATV